MTDIGLHGGIDELDGDVIVDGVYVVLDVCGGGGVVEVVHGVLEDGGGG